MNTVQRYIETEKLALNTYIPIDRYVKNRPKKYETHLLEYNKNMFHKLNASKPRSDAKMLLRPDIHEDEVNQKINNYRIHSDSLANIKIPEDILRKNHNKVTKIIQNRFI